MNKVTAYSLLFLVSSIIFAHDDCSTRGGNRISAVLKKLERSNVQLVECVFTDLFGTQRGLSLPSSHFKSALEDGLSFDGSSIPGMRTIDHSDMLLIPDTETFIVVPSPDSAPVARIVCDVYADVEQPYEGDSRGILKRVVQQACEMGYDFFVGTEMEFFVTCIENNKLNPYSFIDDKRYFETADHPYVKRFEAALMDTLHQNGIDAEKLHDEVAPSQKEFSIHYNNSLKIADDIICAKKSMERLARSMNLHVSFMPKPIFGHNGSGMHINFSLFNVGTQSNAFYDESDKHKLSQIGKQFIAGVLNRIKELTLLFNPTVNSYKRIVPGYEAPCNIGWGELNRSAVIRLPHTRGVSTAKRGELRSPDALCNPYLAFAALLAAGLQGIKNQEQLPEPIEGNVFQLTESQLQERHIDSLPASLAEAVACFEQSDFARQLLGGNLFNQLIALKKKEVREFQTAVTDWEIKRHF